MICLLAGDVERRRKIAAGDELPELGRAGDVGALADIDERDVARQRERLEPRQAHQGRHLRNRTRRLAGDGRRHRPNMRRRRAAAAADHVDEAGLGELGQHGGGRLRAFVVEAELVRQAGIRIGADERVGDLADLLDMGPHLARAEGAVEADRQRRRMADRMPKGGRRLAGQGAAGQVRDGARDHDRQLDTALGEDLPGGNDGRLGVQGVEDRLDQDDLGAAVDEPPHLLAIGVAHLIKGDGAIAGIVDVGRDRQGAVGRPDGAGDEAAAAVFRLSQGRRLAGEARAFAVELVDDRLEPVIGLRDRGARKGVGLDDIGAGLKVAQVDVADGVGLREDEKVVVAAQIVAVIAEALAAKILFGQLQRLDLGSHGAVEHENAFGRRFAQGALDIRTVSEADVAHHLSPSFRGRAAEPGTHDQTRRGSIENGTSTPLASGFRALACSELRNDKVGARAASTFVESALLLFVSHFLHVSRVHLTRKCFRPPPSSCPAAAPGGRAGDRRRRRDRRGSWCRSGTR
jgi:hypothetical protein